MYTSQYGYHNKFVLVTTQRSQLKLLIQFHHTHRTTATAS